MSTADLVSASYQLAHTLDELRRSKIVKFLNFQLENLKDWCKTQTTVYAIVAKSQNIKKEIVTNITTSGALGILTSLSVVLISSDEAPRN